jgi:ATP-dependent exoDNAse (exonuclease V) beta subunit
VTLGHIHLISASAGSGKTHKLVEELEAAITSREAPVRPEAVIATTFTVRAAAELRERVRSRLLERGRVDEAQRLGAARIGTINSVCSQLVGDFAFELGLSPEVQVLDEAAAAQAFERALSSVVSVVVEDDGRAAIAASESGRVLMGLKERWPGLEWLDDVRAIAQKARENGLGPEDLRAGAVRSFDALEPYLQPAAEDGAALERDLVKALEAFAPAPLDKTQATQDVGDVVRRALARLRSGHPLPWPDWVKLATRKPGKKSSELYEPVRAAARGHARHPAPRCEWRECIDAAFHLAADALEAYDGYKRQWGLLDFIDQ